MVGYRDFSPNTFRRSPDDDFGDACRQPDLADSIHVPYQRVNELTNGRRGMTPSTALRLGKYFGTSADYWMNMQLRWDLYHARDAEAKALKQIRSHAVVAQETHEAG